MVFQSYAIWPHMTVFENVAYGLRVRRTEAAEIAEKVHHALDMVQMRSFASRRASQLSGGQQQRVALARAFVFQPSVLLFDEPLSNLDAKLRADMRIELRELQHRLGITSVYVTHDLEEALAMSDRIVVMRDGLIEQTGTPDEIYRLPSNAFVADFVGSANLIRGRHRADLDADGLIALETSAGQIVYGMAYGRAGGRRTRWSRCAPCISAFDGAAGRGAKRLARAGASRRSSRAISPRFTSAGAGNIWSPAAPQWSRWRLARMFTSASSRVMLSSWVRSGFFWPFGPKPSTENEKPRWRLSHEISGLSGCRRCFRDFRQSLVSASPCGRLEAGPTDQPDRAVGRGRLDRPDHEAGCR